MGQEMTKLTPEELKARQIKEMDAEMKQKLQRGANYNMKVVIKGDKNTGKTCLWRRLQRLAFLEDYKSTEQIQIATIAWDYKTTSDKIKVEVWDVVDKGTAACSLNVEKHCLTKLITASKRKESSNLKIGIEGADGLDMDEEETNAQPQLPPAGPATQGSFAVDKLDAETVDVYKNCNAILFTMDPRKKWTFDYIEREMQNIPRNTFVLILVNYRDCPQNQRVITEYEIQEYARNCGKFVRCIECSMKNCYGMKGIRCFFNMPFLKLKRQYIIQQLKENEADLDAADQELDLVNKEQNYDFYLKWLEENIRNRKATAQVTTILPEGPPPRAAIDSTKGTDISSASLEDDSRLHIRDRSASAPHAPAQAAATPTRPNPPKPAPAPAAANTAVRGGVGTGGFGSYSHAFQMHAAPSEATQSQQSPAAPAPRPAQPQPATPQRSPSAPQIQQAASPAPKPSTPAEGGIMSWTSRIFSSPAKPPTTPKKPNTDAVADLQKLAKDPTARVASATSVEDFVPPTEGGDDFWGGDDDDDDDEDEKKAGGQDSEDEDEVSFIAKDEDRDEDDDSPPPMRKQPQKKADKKAEDDKVAKEKLKREREERERREREEKERERERKEKEEKERRERERAQAEALRRQFELQESQSASVGPVQVGGAEPANDKSDKPAATAAKAVPATPNGKDAKKKEQSIWGTAEESDSDDSDDGAWGTPAKEEKKTKSAKKKKKSNPFIMNDEDLPSGDSDDSAVSKPKPSALPKTSASMSNIPSMSISSGEVETLDRRDSTDRGRRTEEREKDRESRRSKHREGSSSSYGDLADATDSPSTRERKERRHRHRDRDDKEKEGRHRRSSKHRGENGSSGSGERESRRSSRHRHRSRSPSPVA